MKRFVGAGTLDNRQGNIRKLETFAAISYPTSKAARGRLK